MNMCRACERDRQAVRKRQKYHADPVFRAQTVAAVRQFRVDNPGKRTAYNRARWRVIKADPILLANERERVRKAQKAYRARQRMAA